MNFIQINKFSKLHDGKKIFFCKTDFIREDFEKIKKINNEVILITGNSDYPITENYFTYLPPNIKLWFAQNALVDHPKLIPIPIGIENKSESYRLGHGIGYYDRVEMKENLLKRNNFVTPSKKIYANFNINTNSSHRSLIKNICENSSNIDWENPTLSLEQFFDKILQYEMIVCPIGNGVDTHRLWEVLYSNRIPITIKTGNFKIHKLYEKLPIIVLDDPNELLNNELIEKKFQECLNMKNNRFILNFDYWENEIKKIIN